MDTTGRPVLITVYDGNDQYLSEDISKEYIVTQDGDVPWVWLCNVDHLYYVRDGVDIGEQKIHPHGHGWSLLNNVDKWSIG